MGTSQVLSLRVKVDLGVMGMNKYTIFHKSAGLKHHHQMQISIISKTLVVGCYSSTEMQSTYSSVPACCIATIISIITVHIQMHIQIQNTGGLCCSGTNAFINFLTSVRRHEESDTILTMLTIPNAWRILRCLTSLYVEIRKTQLHLLQPKSNSRLNWRNSILCLHCPISTLN